MSDSRQGWAAILATIDTRTKLLALIALVTDASFLASLPFLTAPSRILALALSAAILIATIGAAWRIGVAEAQVRPTSSPAPDVVPSPGTPQPDFLNELINSAIHTICRAVSLPRTPSEAKLRVFVFRKEEERLVCTHFWADGNVKERVGRTWFRLDSATAATVAVVRAAMDEEPCGMEIERDLEHPSGVKGTVATDLRYVLATPIWNKDRTLWGTLDFDTASKTGEELLRTRVAQEVLFQVAAHLQILFSLLPAATTQPSGR